MSSESDFRHEELAEENYRKTPKLRPAPKEPDMSGDAVSQLVEVARLALTAGDNADEEWKEK